MNRRSVLKGLVAALAASSLWPRSGAMAATHHTVEILEFTFVPQRLKVAPGDKITWINKDIVPHTATALDESWDSGSLEQGQRQTLTVSDGMRGTYFCRHHPSMVAELV